MGKKNKEEPEFFRLIFGGNKEEFEKIREELMRIMKVPKECIPNELNDVDIKKPPVEKLSLFYIDRCKKCHNKITMRKNNPNLCPFCDTLQD